MARLDVTPAKVSQRLTQPNEQWAVGDGVKTVFFLDKVPTHSKGLWVFVNGLRFRPADRATPYDYSVSGNRVTFTAAPGAVNICFITLTV